MGFSSNIYPGIIFIDVFVNISGEDGVILGAAGSRVAGGGIAAFSIIIFGAVSLKVSRLLAGETDCIGHVARVEEVLLVSLVRLISVQSG